MGMAREEEAKKRMSETKDVVRNATQQNVMAVVYGISWFGGHTSDLTETGVNIN